MSWSICYARSVIFLQYKTMLLDSELFEQAWEDPASAKINYTEGCAAILYGVRALKVDDSVELQAAYDSDFYRPLPSFMVDTMLREGWRRGACLLALDRCDSAIDNFSRLMNDERTKASPDRRRVEHYESRLRNAQDKRLTFLTQL